MERMFRRKCEGGVGPDNGHICSLQGRPPSGKGSEEGRERPGPGEGIPMVVIYRAVCQASTLQAILCSDS